MTSTKINGRNEPIVAKYYRSVWFNALHGNSSHNNYETEVAQLYGDFSCIGKLVSEFLSKSPYKHKTVLSIGCGEGHEIRDLQTALPDARIVGLDTSTDALYKAKSVSDNVELIRCSAFHLPFADKRKFDGIVAGQSFDFFDTEELVPLFEELNRYSVERARLYVAIQGDSEDDHWLQEPLDSRYPFGQFWVHGMHSWREVHYMPYSKTNISPLAKGLFFVAEKL